jgi:EAL and modified HD-GYP domain-containing signal transduction protein
MTEAVASVALGSQVVVGRQGIYRWDRSVDGYELLFRQELGSTTSESNRTSDEMTTDVLVSALNIGLDQLIGDRRLFLNVDQSLLSEPWDLWLPPERTVIELLETVRVDDELVAGCQHLLDLGFSLALDDFMWLDGAERLLPLVSVVKIDLLAVRGEQRRRLVDRCHAYDVDLLAEKIEDDAELVELHELGFTLLQGYALERPQVVAGRAVETTTLARLRTAAELLEDDLEIEEIERVIRTEPGLAYQLVRLASLGRPGETLRRLGTLREAIVMLGTRRSQQFIAILLARPAVDDRPSALVGVLARARACEVLTQRLHPASKSLGFAAGLFSALDAVLGVPIEEIVRSMNLSDELTAALLDPSSPVGGILADVIAYQLDDRAHSMASGAAHDEVAAAFGEGYAFAAHSMSFE